MAVLAVETASQELLGLVDSKHEAGLLISGERAAALNLANERDAADPRTPVVIGHASWLDAATALAPIYPAWWDPAMGIPGPNDLSVNDLSVNDL